MSNYKYFKRLMSCPYCRSAMLTVNGEKVNNYILCEDCGTQYPISFGRPVMLRPDNDVFCINDYRNAKVPDLKEIGDSIWTSLIPKASINLSSERVLSILSVLLESIPHATIVVVGGGNQRKWLDKRLGISDSLDIIYTDIDVGADVDIFCDGHDLPFVDGSIDAVITTAVLEHVLYPERVAAEITRVLKVGGLLYSELPFMQQVHEGAYDFARYTMSGHRRLFNHFSEIDAGMVAGPATAFVWALENLALAFVSRPTLRKLAKIVVRLGFGWIKYLDYLLESHPEAMDGASCTYFMGSKASVRIPDSEIITRYVGAKALRHV
jgi:uncharacterized protein YbaR (Trm112 family)